MTTWTPAQYSAIHNKGKNITVSASAGSGKTTILVERILTRVIQDKVPLDRILAMTFTEAAASEMKKRLFKALNDVKSEAERKNDTEATVYLEEQLVLLQRAKISTIHSFCQSILQENYALIGFSLKRLQNIITDEDAVLLKEQAMKETISRWTSDPAFAYLKQYFSPKPQDQEVLENQVYLIAKALGSMTDANHFHSLWEAIYTARRIEELPSLVRQAFFQFLLDYCQYLSEVLDQMKLSYLGEKESMVETKLLHLNQMIEDAKSGNYSMFHMHFSSYAAIITKTCPDSVQYSNLRALLHKIEDKLSSFLYREETLMADLRSQYPLVKLLVNMALTYSEIFASLKEENEVMDFDDMESKALELLKINDHEIAKRYRDRFIDILVDEYQDSSYHQDELIRLIQNGNNVFRVGDVKQSIYRFRGAVPDLLKGYIIALQEQDEVIHLRHNYRSNSQIISYVNQLFEAFMNLPGYPSLFGSEDVAQVGLEKQMTDRPSVEMHVLVKDLIDASFDSEEESSDEDNEDNPASDELRARYIANLIIKDKTNKNKRWSDYVILVRNHDRKNSLKRAFEYANIPNFIDNREGFYHAPVIEAMRAYFKVILNPDDDLHFTALCLSRIYELDDNAMAKLKLMANRHSFYQTAMQSNDDQLNKIASDIRQLQNEISLSALIRKIYAINGFYENKTTEGERTNLDLLYEKALNFEQDGIHTLAQFIAFTDTLVDEKSSEALSINTQEDVVRVMTIHQSKGLQFDTVIYWGKEEKSRRNKPLIYIDQNLGLGMDYLKLPMRLSRPTLMKLMLDHRNTKEEISEEIRILYVALTRAKEQLFMVTSLKAKEIDPLMQFPLMTYQLQHSMRLSQWIINLSCQLQSPYLSTTFIRSPFSALVVPKKDKAIHQIPKWRHEVVSLPVQMAPTDGKTPHLYDWTSDRKQAKIGTLTHRLIQSMDIKKIYDLAALEDMASKMDPKLAREIKYESVLKLQSEEVYQRCREMEVSKELPFTFINNDGQIVSGYIDFCAIDHDCKQILIFDFKTDANTTKKALLEQYAQQLLTYREAMGTLYPDYEIECYLYSLWLGTFIPVI